jgi:ribosomal protein RSM22 (predicted rRNA methylase)
MRMIVRSRIFSTFARIMLRIPEEYIRALEEVLHTSLVSEVNGNRRNSAFERRIAPFVSQITSGLTKGHSDFVATKYLRERELREAYLAYFMTTNVLKIWQPLRELAVSGFFDTPHPLSLLDLGTGTGTAVWGVLLFLLHEKSWTKEQFGTASFLATDSVSENLHIAREFCVALKNAAPSISKVTVAFEALDISNQSKIAKLASGHAPFRLITMMNVLNEVDEVGDDSLIATLLSVLTPDGALVWIEPASRELSRRALRFRDRLTKHQAFIFAPCLRSLDCPALEVENNWCHTEVKWERPEFIRQIDDLTGNLRLSIKSTYGVALRQDKHLTDALLGKRDLLDAGRVVSEVFHEKGRDRVFVCNESGREEYVLNKRDRNPDNSDLKESERYDIVEFTNLERREHDVKVGENGFFNIKTVHSGARSVDK